MSTANVRKSSIFIPLDVLNSQHGCFIYLNDENQGNRAYW